MEKFGFKNTNITNKKIEIGLGEYKPRVVAVPTKTNTDRQMENERKQREWKKNRSKNN